MSMSLSDAAAMMGRVPRRRQYHGVCALCGAEFDSVREDSIFCSPKCCQRAAYLRRRAAKRLAREHLEREGPP